MFDGLMMDYQLTLDKLLRRAYRVFPEQEVVSRMADHSLHRYRFADFYQRTIRLMNALRALGVKPGDRVATFAWNHYRHFELYFAIPGVGAVLHTLNIRLPADQLTYIVNHADDRFIFADRSLLPILVENRATMPRVAKLIVMDDLDPGALDAPADALDYEELVQAASATEEFLALDERAAAALCYTSGTTGEPKGTLYSHRSTYLHAMAYCTADVMGLSARDNMLVSVPMFHVFAWGMPFAACMVGPKVVFPGPHLIGRPLAELLQDERVTIAAGVPSLWYVMYRFLTTNPYDISRLERVQVGGSATQRSLIDAFEADFGVELRHCWGMTEVSPLGAMVQLKSYMAEWDREAQLDQRAKQGLPGPLVEMKVVDDAGHEQPRDGKSIGELLVRGAWVAGRYYKNDSPDAQACFTDDGWFRTGDIASIDEHGFMEIVDRKKDLIKTRGEWLSSVEMENAVMGHEAVLEAAVVGRPDDVRGEAVVLFVVPTPDQRDALDPQAIIELLEERFERWQRPKMSDIHIVDEIPKTSVGKFDKKRLRQLLAEQTG